MAGSMLTLNQRPKFDSTRQKQQIPIAAWSKSNVEEQFER